MQTSSFPGGGWFFVLISDITGRKKGGNHGLSGIRNMKSGEYVGTNKKINKKGATTYLP